MTSTLATTHGFNDHISDEKVQERGREMGTSTLPDYFKENGYHVMAVGKLFHNHVPKGSVDESGGRGGWNAHPKGRLNYKGGKTLTDWARWPGKEEEMSDPQAAEWAIEHLKKPHDEPFLMMVGFIRPHVPWIVPDRWFDLYPDPKRTTRSSCSGRTTDIIWEKRTPSRSTVCVSAARTCRWSSQVQVSLPSKSAVEWSA